MQWPRCLVVLKHHCFVCGIAIAPVVHGYITHARAGATRLAEVLYIATTACKGKCHITAFSVSNFTITSNVPMVSWFCIRRSPDKYHHIPKCRMQHSYPAQSMPSGVYTQCSAAPCMVPQRSSAGIAQLPLLSAVVYRYILLRLLVTPGIAAGCALIRMDRLKADGLRMFLCSCCPPCGAWPSSRHGQRPLDRLLPARL